MMGLWFEEVEIGRRFELGSYQFTREAILSYARRYDPQPFHVDDAAAAASHFESLSASGWHTAAAWMKCHVETSRAAARHGGPPSGPSPGFTNLKWLKPVKVGDTVAYAGTVTAKRQLASRPAWGLVMSQNEGTNQRGELVFAFEGKVLVARRPGDRPA